jgi:hypothetical protein
MNQRVKTAVSKLLDCLMDIEAGTVTCNHPDGEWEIGLGHLQSSVSAGRSAFKVQFIALGRPVPGVDPKRWQQRQPVSLHK